MPTTLRFQSFAPSNLRERTALSADAVAEATSLTVESTEGYVVGQIIYVGNLGQEGCESASVGSIGDETTIGLSAGLGYSHGRYEAATSVLGGHIRIYRAPDVDGSVPSDDSFSVYATSSIDPDQPDTFYTDSSGSSAYWYRHTYFNETTQDETTLTEFDPVRGDDFAHYASLDQIRIEAGFQNATNLSKVVVDQQRRAAEAEINTALGTRYDVPFTRPVPAFIESLTIKLAAGLLLALAYGHDNPNAKEKLKSARSILADLKTGDTSIEDADGESLASPGFSSWPNDSTATADAEDGGGERMFRVSDVY